MSDKQTSKTRVVPVTLKIVISFALFILISNFVTNYVNLVFNRAELFSLMNQLLIKDLKVIRGAENYFIAMPAKQTKDGRYVDIAHPLNKETRQDLEKTILEEYNRITNSSLSPNEGMQSAL